jgi:hypothetical protein
MARLAQPSEEVWEIRVLDTNPQLRLFGRFADRNMFVVLIGPIQREYLETEADFEQAKRDCKAEWIRLFGVSNPPLQGNDAHDYISRPFRVV